MRVHAHLGIVLALLVGLFVSSVYVHCLEHASRADTESQHGHDGLSGSHVRHEHAHSDHSGTNGSEGTSNDDLSNELCHHPSHGAGSETLIVQTICDRCADRPSALLPEPTVAASLFPESDRVPLDPHMVGFDRPPIRPA